MISKFFESLARLFGIKPKMDSAQLYPVRPDTLPTQSMNYYFDAEEALKKVGVVFGKEVPDDPLFQFVTFPQGWKIIPTENPLWSHLLDARGRRRVEIFYNSSSFNRSAHFTVERRYNPDFDRNLLNKEGLAVGIVYDCGHIIHKTEAVSLDPPDEDIYGALSDEAVARATNWLDINYPNWKDPAAYWD